MIDLKSNETAFERISLYLKVFVALLMSIGSALLVWYIMASFDFVIEEILNEPNEVSRLILHKYVPQGESFIQNIIIILLALAVMITISLFFIINYYLKRVQQKEHEAFAKTQELYFNSRHHHLSNLPSMNILNENIALCENYSVLMLDIDNISIFNTTYGNDTVDMLIKEAALYLRNNLPYNGTLYHLRADEFVILLTQPSKNQTKLLAQQIKSYFENTPLQAKGIRTHLNFSFGIARFSDDSQLNAFAKANIALVEAKRRGRSLIVEFESSMSEYSSYTQIAKQIGILQKYIEEDLLIPFYQPIVDTQTQEIVKYEALARIKNADKFLSPHEFLQAAELAGLMTAITKQMIQKSFLYFAGTDICFSINITKNDFLEKNLIKFLRQKCKIHQINPKQVTLEILENIAMGESAKEIIEQIRVLAIDGYMIAIDDFGVESSNISRLSDLNANFIKIDGSFIQDINTNEKHRKIVESLVFMAKKLDVKIIAEYVCNKEVYDVVKELGIDYSQGYYFSEPKISIKR